MSTLSTQTPGSKSSPKKQQQQQQHFTIINTAPNRTVSFIPANATSDHRTKAMNFLKEGNKVTIINRGVNAKVVGFGG